MAVRSASPDIDLGAALAANLCESFEALVVAYQDRLYAFALRLTCQAQDAEEVTQDAFVRAYRALERYEADRVRALAVRPWLYQIVLNVARNRFRGKQLMSVSLDGSEDGTGPQPEADAGEQPEAVWERAEESDALATLLMQLPERYRTAIILKHVEGLGYQEVATILEQPVGTVKANVHRGLQQLRTAATRSMDKESLVDGQR